MIFRTLFLGLTFAAFAASVASATPTPIPGGANQVSAVSATLGQTIFNGNLRITVSEFGDASDADTASFRPNPSQKVMTFRTLLRNGTNSNFTDLMHFTLADKDGVAVLIPDGEVAPANLNIIQGGATRQKAIFAVDKDFVPVKLIIECATCGSHTAFRAVRFKIPQQ